MSTTTEATRAPDHTVKCIANFLQTGGYLQNFKFPRIKYPNWPGYNPELYAEIGRRIGSGRIPIFLREGNIEGAKAFYNLTGNELNLTSATKPLNRPSHWGTIVHEATHMIQDMKNWRMTKQEMEADAHFAQALFLHYKGTQLESGLLQAFNMAARHFANGDKKEYKKKFSLMLSQAGAKYHGKAGYDDLYINKRWGGN